MFDQNQGTLRYVSAHWPYYVGGVTAGAGLLVLLLVSAREGWWGFVPMGMGVLLILLYFMGASLWAARERFDDPQVDAADLLYGLGRLRPEDNILHVELGERTLPLKLLRKLTSGRLTVVDVYTPQVMPAAVIPRWRQLAPPYDKDPRVIWRAGAIDLLPLPDASVFAVTMHDIFSQIEQEGDRQRLLREVYRVLRPGGRLLLAEQTRTQMNWLVMGVSAAQLPDIGYWRRLLGTADLKIVDEVNVKGLITFFRADKITAGVGRQLPFEWSGD